MKSSLLTDNRVEKRPGKLQGFNHVVKAIDVNHKTEQGPDSGHCSGFTYDNMRSEFSAELHQKGPRDLPGNIKRFLTQLPLLQNALNDYNFHMMLAQISSMNKRTSFQIIRKLSQKKGSRSPKLISYDYLNTLSTDSSPQNLTESDRILIEPDQKGPAELIRKIAHSRQMGINKIYLGYHSSLAAEAHWPGFRQHGDYEEFRQFLRSESASLQLEELSFLIALPPCATCKTINETQSHSEACSRKVAAEMQEFTQGISVQETQLAVRAGDWLIGVA